MEISINGRQFDIEQVAKTRALVVIDRGWVFCGDVTERNGRIRLDKAVHVIRWESVGFDGMIANPKSSQVVLRTMTQPVDLPAGSEVFRIPVPEGWGL